MGELAYQLDFPSAIIILFFGSLFLHHIILGIKGITKTGLKPYLKWVLFKDIRLFLIILFYGLIIYLYRSEEIQDLNIPNWVICFVFFSPIYPLAKSISPPQILLLHKFHPKSYEFGRSLIKLVPLANIISLLPTKLTPGNAFKEIDDAMVGRGSRYAGNDWKDMIENYMNWAELIMFDLSIYGDGLNWEIEHLSSNNRRKTIFIASSREQLSKRLFQKVSTLFPEATIFLYNQNPKFDRDARVGGNGHPLAKEILSRISTHRMLPLIFQKRRRRKIFSL
ncbi:MAG: hypothetical protein H6563_15095 [Lewinellaceae bacterium]|nr:hypothetical protein [Lewinellaceae bacterium]